MNRALTIISGFGLGAAMMYLFDPSRGNRRRAIARDKAYSTLSHSRVLFSKSSRDLAHRATGAVAAAASRVRFDRADDDIIVARVRSKLGRVVRNPHAIQVTAQQGNVTLQGPILKQEVDHVLSATKSVRGVRRVENQLDVHTQADIPSLQTGNHARRTGERFELMQTNWTPGVRMLVGTAGGALAAYGISRRDPVSIAASVIGTAMLARAGANEDLGRIVGVQGGRRAVDVVKTIKIQAPVEEVFSFWTNYENFPRFMRNIEKVRDLGNGRSHWVVAGPAKSHVGWTAEITRFEQNKLIAWKSAPDSTIANAGIIRFEPGTDGGTRVHIRISYNPPAGVIGHAFASLFGADPKHEMDQDLIRMKSLLEQGKTRLGRGERIRREDLVQSMNPGHA